mmetsp:Transcript_89626/g.204860  ORF Transcript_89626/g.204860 Transcript_89626/m.204860 type:complete len:533 (+) Transcript_89626:86-1684(+)
MSGPSPPSYFEAERAAAYVLDLILEEAGQTLYGKYIEKKAFSFAAEAITESLVSHLEMCYVKYDPGERDMDDWVLEPEPVPNAIDTWARASVPVRRKLRIRKQEEGAPTGARSVASNRLGKGKNRNNYLTSEGRESPSNTAPGNRQPIPLKEEFEVDEKEEALREMQERVAKRQREEALRLRQREQEELEDQMRLAKVRDEMKNKPYTFDTEGNLLWIQQVNTEKLPAQSTSVNYKSRPKVAKVEEEPKRPTSRGREPRDARPKAQKQVKHEYTDTFKKLTTQQAPAIDVMNVAPGVVLIEKGRQKKGPEPDGPTLSRDAYKQMADSGAGGIPPDYGNRNPKAEDQKAAREDERPPEPAAAAAQPAPPAQSPSVQQMAGAQATSDAAAARQAAAADPTRAADWGQAPPRQGGSGKEAAVPDRAHDPRQKFAAIGHIQGLPPRNRIPPLGTTVGARLPQPVLGATMGHGLMRGNEGVTGDFYFPGAGVNASQIESSMDAGTDAAREAALLQKQAKEGGVLKAQNRELMQRLFQ